MTNLMHALLNEIGIPTDLKPSLVQIESLLICNLLGKISSVTEDFNFSPNNNFK